MKEIQTTKVEEKSLALWWIGQAGFALKTSAGRIIMVDPYLSFSMEDVTYIHETLVMDPHLAKVDYVFCSHDHMDHTDEATIVGLAAGNPESIFFGPISSADKMRLFGLGPERVRIIERGNMMTPEPRFSVEAVYAHHTEDSVGFIFNFSGIVVYFTGDTEVGLSGYMGEMTRVQGLRPDLMIVCINPGFRNLGPQEAAWLTQLVGPRVVIPMHYDLIEENTVNPQEFFENLKGRKVSTQVELMEHGGGYIYVQG